MKQWKPWVLACGVGLVLTSATVRGERFMGTGHSVGGPSVFEGKRGYTSGTNQSIVFQNDKGEVIWSSHGGWLRGAQDQVSSKELLRIREDMRQQKADEDRRRRAGRENPEYGSNPGTFHGYAGYWSGSVHNAFFVSNEFGIIYSSRGGFVEGFGPDFEPTRAKWGAGISDDAQIYESISDPNTIRRASHLTANRLYAVVDGERKFVTVAYEAAGRVVLENKPIPSGTTVPGFMIEKPGGEYKFVEVGRGYRFEPIP